MPGGDRALRPEDNPKPFTKDYQPANAGRKPEKFLTALLKKELQSTTDIIVEAEDIETGEKRKVKLPATNQEAVIRALLKKAAKGNVPAIREVFDRTEGKVTQTVEVQGNVAGSVAIGIPDNGRGDAPQPDQPSYEGHNTGEMLG